LGPSALIADALFQERHVLVGKLARGVAGFRRHLQIGIFLERFFKEALLSGVQTANPSVSGLCLYGGNSFRLAGAGRALLGGWLTIAFLERGYDHRGNELFLAVVVEFNDNALLGTREHSSKTEFLVLNLSSLVKISHVGVG
jgi:hypothetical protein